MEKTFLYDWKDEFNFGQHKGSTLENVFKENPSYLDWCFQKVEWFCITDKIFEKLPVIKALKKKTFTKSIDKKKWLKKFLDLHESKKLNSVKVNSKKSSFHFNEQNNYEDYHNFNWLAEAAGSSDPDDMREAYWNME